MLSIFNKKTPVLSPRKMRRIAKEFGRNAGCTIILIDGAVWPVGKNDSKTKQKLVETISKKIHATPVSSEIVQDYFMREATATDLASFYLMRFNCSDGSTRMFNIIQMRPLTEKEWRNSYIGNDLHPDVNYTDFAEFVLYHELFHTYCLHTRIGDASDEHRNEFFADFSACLMMASQGKEHMFLEIAKWRALSTKRREINTWLDYEESKTSDKEIKILVYLNHHIYGVYKMWRKENPDINLQDLSQDKIARISLDMMKKHSYTEDGILNFMADQIDRSRQDYASLEKHQEHQDRLKKIQNRRIGRWQKAYRLRNA